MAAPLAPVTDLAAFSQRDVDPATARVALDYASGAIRSYCGWSLSREIVTGKRLTGTGRRSLWLPTLYLVSVDAVSVDGVALTSLVDFDWTENGQLVAAYRWPRGARSVTVSFTHGYEPDDPRMDMVRGVAIAAAGRLVDNPMNYGNWSVGNESYGLRGNAADVSAVLSAAEKHQLDSLQLPVVV